jgi:hypothetical protein
MGMHGCDVVDYKIWESGNSNIRFNHIIDLPINNFTLDYLQRAGKKNMIGHLPISCHRFYSRALYLSF